MKILAYIFAWLALVALPAAYGLIKGGTFLSGGGFDWDDAWQSAIGYGALGMIAATLIVPGLFAVIQVRSGLGRGFGILIVTISSIFAGAIPPFLVKHSGYYSSGDAGMTVPLFLAPLAAVSGLFGFIVLAFCVALVRRKVTNAA
jgi:hypothetical protein